MKKIIYRVECTGGIGPYQTHAYPILSKELSDMHNDFEIHPYIYDDLKSKEDLTLVQSSRKYKCAFQSLDLLKEWFNDKLDFVLSYANVYEIETYSRIIPCVSKKQCMFKCRNSDIKTKLQIGE